MSEDRITKVILSNMCMLYKNDEYGETLEESIIREMKEETGLDIKNPRLVGIKDWPWGNNVRYFALLYVSNEFEGEIISSKEGEVFRLKEKDFSSYLKSLDFDELFEMFKKGI